MLANDIPKVGTLWFRAFLLKAIQVADNLVFIGLAPAWFVQACQEDVRQARFALVELCALPTPASLGDRPDGEPIHANWVTPAGRSAGASVWLACVNSEHTPLAAFAGRLGCRGWLFDAPLTNSGDEISSRH